MQESGTRAHKSKRFSLYSAPMCPVLPEKLRYPGHLSKPISEFLSASVLESGQHLRKTTQDRAGVGQWLSVHL